MSYLGKRKVISYAPRKSFRSNYYARPAAGTAYRSYRRVMAGSRRAPFRTGGFYGASVRSPQERKVIERGVSAYTLDITGDIVLINGVATGTDFTDRIGRRTNCVSVQLRGWFSPVNATTSVGVGDMIRILLIHDSQTNGVAPTIANIFQTTIDVNSFMNLDNRERFKVLYDKKVYVAPFNATVATQNTNNMPIIDVYKKCNIPTIYEGTAATVGSVSSGAIWLVCWSQSAAATVVFNGTTRVRFVDA